MRFFCRSRKNTWHLVERIDLEFQEKTSLSPIPHQKGAAHISWKHRLAFETMKKWMIENNCQDYAKFYERYKKREKGNWRSGNLIEGKANYLKSTLPFPNPDGANPGDILNVGADTHRKSRGVTEARRDGTWGDDHPSKNPKRWFSAEGKNPGEFWTINTRPFKGAHFAVFPEELCVRPILSSCPPGGVVLDPFAGSGTVGVVAKRLGRNFILIDINREYCELARKRLTAAA
jgi:hypothetical protein